MPSSRTSRSRLPLLLGLLTLLGLTGCSQRYEFLQPEPSVKAPEAFSRLGTLEEAPTDPGPDRWWEGFEDDELDGLVGELLEENLDLKAAWARLRQSRAGARLRAAQNRGQVDLTSTASKNQLFLQGRPIPIERHSVSLPASYEIDLWNKLDAEKRAAHLDADAVRSDVEGLAVSLVAELVQTWIGIREQQARRDLLLEQLETNQGVLDSIKVRFDQGQSSSLDYYQQEQLLEATRASIELVDGEKARLSHRLAVLRGKVPGGSFVPAHQDVPTPPPLPAPGLPADLLNRRPDLRAAFRGIEAQDHRLAAGLRDRLPSLRVSGSFSYQAGNPAGLFRTLLRSLVGDFSLPFVDHGRRRREIERRRARLDEAIHVYSQRFLLALEEVENALALEEQQRRNIAELENQEATARKAFAIATVRYREGGEDFIRVLSSLDSLHRVQLNLVAARGQRLRYRIQLHRALGGAWPAELAAPARAPEPGVRREVPKAGHDSPKEST